ncbi:MAG: DoxX-like family protein [Alloalcanivorax sp.]
MNLQVCRFSLGFIWLYQGIVPKLLGPHADELRMNMALGLSDAQAHLLSYMGGAMEVVLGLLVVVFYRQRWPYVISIAALLGLFAFTLFVVPAFTVSAFNSTTINLAMCALAVIALSELRMMQSGH